VPAAGVALEGCPKRPPVGAGAAEAVLFAPAKLNEGVAAVLVADDDAACWPKPPNEKPEPPAGAADGKGSQLNSPVKRYI
jgi:hypothetical protein